MNTKSMKFMIVVAICLAAVLAACSTTPAAAPAAPAAPTVDTAALANQVAKTVIAKITQEAALNPSATPEPKALPTSTEVPTSVPPTPTEVTAVISTPIPTLAQPTEAAKWNVQPTFTKTVYTDACVLESTSPEDYARMGLGENFTAKWVLRNKGFRSWNTQFYFKKVTGDLGPASITYLPGQIAPNETFTFELGMETPKKAGTYTGTYKLVNDDGVAICQFYVAVTAN